MIVILVKMRDGNEQSFRVSLFYIFQCYFPKLFNGDIFSIILMPGKYFMSYANAVFSFSKAVLFIYLKLLDPLINTVSF